MAKRDRPSRELNQGLARSLLGEGMGCSSTWPPRRFQILSLDGGGIRGLYTSSLLAELEVGLGRSVVDHFDLIAGTSTGGIIALGLALGKSPEELATFYREYGPKIFPRPKGFWARLRHKCRVKYDAVELEAALHREFDEQRLEDCSRALVIPTYNLDTDKPVVLKTPHCPEFRADPQIEAWKVALATSAAPTYFPANAEIRGCRHVDGGVWANNPALVGAIEAHHFLGVPLDAIHVLTIGTGSVVKDRSKALNRGGQLAWRSEAADVLLRAQSEGAQNQVRLLLGDEQVMRINPAVSLTWDALDVIRDEFTGQGKEDAKTHLAEVTKRFTGHVGLDLYQLRAASGEENHHA